MIAGMGEAKKDGSKHLAEMLKEHLQECNIMMERLAFVSENVQGKWCTRSLS
jgi:hypothetical protein